LVEDLLTKLLWLSANVHFRPEYAGIQTFTWRVDLLKWSLYEKESIEGVEPIRKDFWEYEGDASWEDFKR